MEFGIVESNNGKIESVTITNGDEVLTWSCAVYNRSTIQDIDNFFKNLNGYINTLGESKIRTLWKCYFNIYNAISSINDINRLHEFIKSQMRMLYNVILFDDLKRWCILNGDIIIPSEIKEKHENEVTNRTRDRTYLRDDYYDLAVFVIMMKFALPVFAQYLREIKDDIMSSFKEHYSFSLLKESKVVTIPVFKRFEKHIAASIEGETPNKSAITEGLGSSAMPEWFLTKMIVRRVCLAEETVGNNIAAVIFHGINSGIDGMDRTFGGKIKDKDPLKTNRAEDNISIVENYNMKETVSAGDLGVFSTYVSNYINVRQIEPTVTQRMLKINKGIPIRHEVLQNNHNRVLTQWVLSVVISGRSIYTMPAEKMKQCMAVTKTLLQAWGFYELALMLYVVPVAQSSSIISAGTSRLSKKYVDELINIYPYYQAKNSKEEQKGRDVNPGIIAINSLTSLLTAYDWEYITNEEIAKELHLKGTTGVHIVTADIKSQLAELLLKIIEVKRRMRNVRYDNQ